MSRSAAVSIAAVVGAIVLIVAVALLVVRPWEGSRSGAADAELVDERTHVLQDAGEGAPVVVEFFDYECPACAQFHPIVEELRAQHEGEVTFAVRYFPLSAHPNAVPAAAAAEAASQQGEFEAMHDRLFETQDAWAGSPDAAATFRGYAEELGLDLAAYDEAVAAESTADRIALDVDAGVAAGVRSTPTFFVDGEQLELRDYSDLATAIDAALAE